MSGMGRTPWTTIAVALPALLLPLACSTSSPSSSASVSSPSSSAAADGTASTDASPSVTDGSAPPTPGSDPQTFQATPTLGSGPFSLPAPSIGLADLASYTATLTLTFQGTAAGQPSVWSTTSVLLATNDPVARQLTITKTGDVPDATPLYMAELNGAAYEQRGQAPCTADAITPDEPSSLLFEPAAELLAVIGGDTAGSEAVNDVPADHYTFDEQALGQAGRATSTGDVWVATTGGFVVKYVVDTTATADYFGDGIEGTVTWDYELTTVDQPVAIALPEGCPPGIVAAPQLADATNVESLPGVLTFDTVTGLADIVAFYQAQLGPLGWTPAGDPTVDEANALVEFTQGAALLTVTATIDAGVTTVQLLLTPAT